tara:strand:+ start:9658 stop:10323 length:666 start_codon:yes stop_codon:yes gene_type:complete
MKKLLLILLCVPFIGFGQQEFYDSYNLKGFSVDGFVAYELISFGIDELGDNWEESKLYIQDLKTDEVVWSGINYDEKVFLDYGVLIDSNLVFEACECYYEDDLEKKLLEFGNHNDEYQAYSLGVYYDYQPDINRECDFEHPLYTKAHILMYYQGDEADRRKKIGTISSKMCYSKFNFIGYYKSPFEMRIVLIFASTQIDGPYSSSTNYKFVGCSLNPNTFN